MAEIMPMQLTGSGTANATSNAVAAIDIPQDGDIVGFDGVLEAPSMADDTRIRCSLSFLSTNQFDSNDARGTIAEWRSMVAVVTSGGGNVTSQKWINLQPDGISVSGGERLYVHTDSSAANATPRFNIVIYLRVKSTTRRSRRRR